tara:strand:+ start:46579 stop:47079 length:501 start_codon:yes stop_codon:yes gene_type:complete
MVSPIRSGGASIAARSNLSNRCIRPHCGTHEEWVAEDRIRKNSVHKDSTSAQQNTPDQEPVHLPSRFGAANGSAAEDLPITKLAGINREVQFQSEGKVVVEVAVAVRIAKLRMSDQRTPCTLRGVALRGQSHRYDGQGGWQSDAFARTDANTKSVIDFGPAHNSKA